MSSNANEITSCEVCGNQELHSVLDLGNHPMCDDLVEVGNSRVCREYPIEILFCKTCKTAHQRFQVPKQDLFPDTYHYRSRFTADVINGMKTLVAECNKVLGDLEGKTVLDIGCNDGSLLDVFRSYGAKTVGVEPTGASKDAAEKNHVIFDSFFTSEIANEIISGVGKPDVVTFTNVFAHIEDLESLLAALKSLLSPDTIIVIENHYLGAVLDKNQFDTFYHEHPRTYSCTSFAFMAKTLELSILNVEFPSRYGGNIRVILGNENAGHNISKSEDLATIETREEKYFDALQQLASNVGVWQTRKKQQIDDYVRSNGKLNAKAFPGRAAILVKMLGLDENIIEAVFEKPGSLKIGHYLPGTRIPIKSDNDLFQLPQNTDLLNFAWHIPEEIRTYLAENGNTGNIYDILNSEDFKG